MFIYLGKCGYVPPAGIFIGEFTESVPRVVIRIFALVCAYGIVVSVSIEVYAVLSRMAEHAVDNYTHAELFGAIAQGRKVFLGAEDRVYLHIIAGVVAMVAPSLKNGV